MHNILYALVILISAAVWGGFALYSLTALHSTVGAAICVAAFFWTTFVAPHLRQ